MRHGLDILIELHCAGKQLDEFLLRYFRRCKMQAWDRLQQFSDEADSCRLADTRRADQESVQIWEELPVS